MKHLLRIPDFTEAEAREVFRRTTLFKSSRATAPRPLAGQTWAMIFSKSSTRTRVSFEVGLHELGARALFLNAGDIQLGRGEPIKDTARVLGRMVHGAVIRTFAQQDVDDFAAFSAVPTINALTDEEHPCQILTDIFTFEEKRGPIRGKKVAFIGDADCNVCRSWVEAAPIFGFELHCAAPEGYQTRFKNDHVALAQDPVQAVQGADLVYTDVWVSMGKEEEAATRLRAFQGYQINQGLMQAAHPQALVLHCLPAYRGKEITDELFESRAGDIFDQAENRLHVQKGIVDFLQANR
ncbi:MAG: ornithine carbamoyltransferase [Candidatus Methylacidiphilales bacterium]|nr:ornithine carbamoyltransferase [Candidatus Methylacidiphilales bacterium]